MPLPEPGAPVSLPLSERAILVTGATGGLGSAIAHACAQAGATVVLHGRVVRKLEALYDTIVAAGHPQPTILPLDLAKAGDKDFATVAQALAAQLGRLDGIVHTASLLGSLGPLEHQRPDTWSQVLHVDVIAAMALTRATLPLLRLAPDAAVVFTLASRGQSPRAYWGAHAVAKAGVAALATIVADEWENEPKLRVDAVVPGPLNSPLRARTHPGEDRSAHPAPAALAPLYLHLIAGQAKAESGRLIDAAAWLADQPCSTPLVPAPLVPAPLAPVLPVPASLGTDATRA